jgi:hypothetical protein
LAGILTRVWAGEVASNFDYSMMLNSGFNGALSKKVLAIVDEINEGGSEQFMHAEKMKSVVTEEFRTVNPKYGRQSIEFNSTRWLLFSNHLSAIPVETDCRRYEVVLSEDKPMPPDYYQRLYHLRNDHKFIQSVALFLKQRDISNFNAGQHAELSEAKKLMVQASKSNVRNQVDLLIKYWPVDVICYADLVSVLYEDEMPNRSINKLLSSNNIRLACQDKFTVYGLNKRQRMYILRNHELYVDYTDAVNYCISAYTQIKERKFGQTGLELLESYMPN